YVVQYNNFGELEQIWDATGKVLAEVVKRPLREAPDTSDDPAARRNDGGKRSLAWLPRGDGLSYLEPIPSSRERTVSSDAGVARGGPAGGGSTRPDRLVKWLPPFGKGDTAVLDRADGPIAQLAWSADASTIFVGTTRSGTGELYAVRLSEP